MLEKSCKPASDSPENELVKKLVAKRYAGKSYSEHMQELVNTLESCELPALDIIAENIQERIDVLKKKMPLP